MGMEKRKYERYQCKVKAQFNFYEGNPDEIDVDVAIPKKGKGVICDISQGGVCIISKERVAVGIPTTVYFKIKKNQYAISGKIVRTGFLRNNPSEAAKKFAKLGGTGDSYIAVEFQEPIELPHNDL
jgi:hypothetical protein